MKVAIIGAGLQGRRRAQALKRSGDVKLVLVASLHLDHARALAADCGGEATDRWQDVLERDDVDAVLVCTPTCLHASMTIASLERGLHVLCEKPLARTVEEGRAMVAAAQSMGRPLKCGFNHRHHPAVQQARKWFETGEIGEPMFVRCRYGICGRPEYGKEWRAALEQSGGGHLMEQGIHGIDLARWFLGDFSQVTCFAANLYWEMPVEDNAFALFRTAGGQIASIHASLTQWRNLFSFELFGKEGYVQVEGLGGGYGTERAVLGKRDFHKPFTEEIVEYRGDDRSWDEEWREFAAAIAERREPLGSGHDGVAAVRAVLAAYEANRCGSVVQL